MLVLESPDRYIRSMDKATSAFYERYAAELTPSSEHRRSAMLPVVERRLRAGASVLDVGSGSGRDVAAMLACGLDAYGVEPNGTMLDKALAFHPQLRGRLRSASLPRLGRPFSDLMADGFDAVVCSAVLMHLEIAELPSALASMVDQLRVFSTADCPGTRATLFLSLPRMESSRLIRHRDQDGRRFHHHDAAQVQGRLTSLGLSLQESISSDAVLTSTETVWNTMVFCSDVRPLPLGQ